MDLTRRDFVKQAGIAGAAAALQSDPTTQLTGLPAASTGGGPRPTCTYRILIGGVVTIVGAGQDHMIYDHPKKRH